MSIPHLLRCPISLDLFTDPVTLSTGQTYDRPSIERWLADGNKTCPVTMQRLHDTTLVPNRTLRHLIDQWLLSGLETNSLAKSMTKPNIEGTTFSLATLKLNLQSPATTLPAKLEMLKKIRILSVESDTGQACLIQLGFFPLLLKLLFQSQSSPWTDPELVEIALDCLLSLSSSSHLDALNMLKKTANLAILVLLLEQGNLRIKTSLCYLLEKIATSMVTAELCGLIGQTRRILHVLVYLLHLRSDARAAATAAGAICGICSLEANRATAIREGAVDGLIAYLSNPTVRNASRVLATMENLVELDAGKKALIKNTAAVGILVRMVFRVSSNLECSEHAVGALLMACCESGRVRADAVAAGVLKQLLLLLQSQCSCKAKAKARALLKLLRSMWAQDPGGVCNVHNAM